MIVLDSSALLAMLFFEPGCERAARVRPQSCMSSVHLAEIMGRLARDGRALDQMLDRLDRMGTARVALDCERAILATALLRRTAPFGLSLDDRPCPALARLRDLPATPPTAPERASIFASRSRSCGKARCYAGASGPKIRP